MRLNLVISSWVTKFTPDPEVAGSIHYQGRRGKLSRNEKFMPEPKVVPKLSLIYWLSYLRRDDISSSVLTGHCLLIFLKGRYFLLCSNRALFTDNSLFTYNRALFTANSEGTLLPPPF
uniref:Uncharacterized protein n=1 Tax=Cacopsylla melanoneura TaxID=428564 RepID=A0A8D9BUX1_9HEMI